MATRPDDSPHKADPDASSKPDAAEGVLGHALTAPVAGDGEGVDPPRLAEGAVVAGRYRVVRFLARGGMGEVYEADDLELGERVALKTIRAEGSDVVNEERFKREIQLSRKVTHPNVCRIFDVGYHDVPAGGRLVFLTMELISGETLLARIRRKGPLSFDEASRIARQIAAALTAAHAVGVVHRDLKSANVLLGVRKDGSVRAAVADFGLAHWLGGAGDQGRSLTGSGAIVGTPAYMSPEQVEGGPITPRTDIYALGVVMFEMTTGQLPFEGKTPLSIAAKRLTSAPKPPRKLRPELPPAWEHAVLHCLARDAEDRPATARAAVEMLDEESSEFSLRLERLRRRAPIIRPLLAIFVLGCAAFLGFRVWRSGPRGLGRELRARGVEIGEFEPRTAERVPGFGVLLRNALSVDLAFDLPVVERPIDLRTLEGRKVALGFVAPAVEGRTPLRVEGSFDVTGEPTERVIEVTMLLVDTDTHEQRARIVETGRVRDIEDVVVHLGKRLRAAAAIVPVQRQPLSREGAVALAGVQDALRRLDCGPALALAQRALIQEQGALELRYVLGRSLACLQLDIAASVAMQRAAALEGGDPELRQRVEAAIVRRDSTRVVRTLETLHARHPADLELAIDLSNALSQGRRSEDAVLVIDQLRARVSSPLDQMRVDVAALDLAARQDRTMELAQTFPGLLQRARAAGQTGIEVRVLDIACRNEAWRGDSRQTTRVCGELAEVGRAHGQPGAVIAGVINGLGAYVAGNESPDLAQNGEQAVQLARQQGSRLRMAEALNTVAMLNNDLTLNGSDLEMLHEALDYAQAVSDHTAVASILFDLAYYADNGGHVSAAMGYLRDAIDLSVDNGAPLFRYDALCRMGIEQLNSGNTNEAQQSLDEANRLLDEVKRAGHQQRDAADLDCNDLEGLIESEAGHVEQAMALMTAGERAQAAMGNEALSRDQIWGECRMLQTNRRFAEALRVLDRYEARAKADDVSLDRSSLAMRGVLLGELGRKGEAQAMRRRLYDGSIPPAAPATTEQELSLALDVVLGMPAAELEPQLDALIESSNARGEGLRAMRVRLRRGALWLREGRPDASAELVSLRDEARERGDIAIAEWAVHLLGAR